MEPAGGGSVWITDAADMADNQVDYGIFLQFWNDPSGAYKTIEYIHALDGQYFP